MNFVGKVGFRGLKMTSGNSFGPQNIVRHFSITDTVTKFASDKLVGDKGLFKNCFLGTISSCTLNRKEVPRDDANDGNNTKMVVKRLENYR
jgi:hypothetical protein